MSKLEDRARAALTSIEQSNMRVLPSYRVSVRFKRARIARIRLISVNQRALE